MVFHNRVHASNVSDACTSNVTMYWQLKINIKVLAYRAYTDL